MSYDNKVFRVNGSGVKMLEKALELIFMQHGSNTAAVGFKVDPVKGLVLFWHSTPGMNRFISKSGHSKCAQMIIDWLDTDEARAIPPSEDCDEIDLDGSLDSGWEVYTEMWGRVGEYDYSICAIKPAFLWIGK